MFSVWLKHFSRSCCRNLLYRAVHRQGGRDRRHADGAAVWVRGRQLPLHIDALLRPVRIHITGHLRMFRKPGVRCSSVVRAFALGARGRRVDPLSYFSFQPVLHDWCNKGCAMGRRIDPSWWDRDVALW